MESGKDLTVRYNMGWRVQSHLRTPVAHDEDKSRTDTTVVLTRIEAGRGLAAETSMPHSGRCVVGRS